MIMLPLILAIFCCFLIPPSTVCFNNHSDFLSLLAFKSSLEDPQGALHSWKPTLHFCSWKGISCSKRYPDRVVEINLESQGLVGPLSPHLGNLSLLTTIDLQRNSFRGQIPQEISLLTRLEHLDFRANSFVGSIPRNLSQCPNLVFLDFHGNNLSGNIPYELGSLSELQVLNLGSNKFPGQIPPFIGNISSLMNLSLVSCDFYGEIPESLARLQTLKLLQLGENRLNGTVPNALFNISTLQYLGFRKNRLHGVIPSTIGLTLPNLTHLYLSDNQFSGSIPVSISNASFIQQLILNSNELSGPIPRVEKLTQLSGLVVGENHIEDDISFISSLNNSTNLQYIEVDVNQLTGSLPDSIANLSTQLHILDLSSNRIYGNIPSSIGSLNLIWLSVAKNDLDGAIPVDITVLSNLEFLNVENNRFSSELPASIFQNFTRLTRLFLGSNRFSGNVPASIGNCTNLLELNLNRNDFSGLIPPQIMKLPSISILLDLSYNSFHGLVPEEVGSLTHLGMLDLSNNRLSGSVPNSLAKCSSLEKLYLEENLLEGEIPPGLSSLMGLQYLDLSRNNLFGRIPSFLYRLNLEYLNLSFNRLQGEVPTAGVFKDITAISLDGNEQLCGGISELELPPCPAALLKSQKKKLSTAFKILIPALISGGICLVLFAYKWRMWGRNETTSAPVSIGVQFIMRLSYADLLKATGGFSEANLLGTGRFGSVYKGVLDDGQTLVAVKVLNLFVRGASKSFMAECNALRDIRHRNLLKILSVCESIDFQGNDFKALVYEFKANGSLEKWLHEEKSETGRLNAIQRLDIAIDIAQAIEYLHFGTDLCVVHGDLKPSNILLDREMSACVGDFGLAKIVSASHESYTSIGIRGTIGYVPPEYGTSNSVSTQGDVYSFGVVLLEMFTNKRPMDDLGSDHANLRSFVVAGLHDRVVELIDPRLERGAGKKMKECMATILSIGVACTNELPRERMSMEDVVNELHKIQKLCNQELIVFS